MNTMKRALAVLLLAGGAVSLTTPAMAAPPSGAWTWRWESNIQSQNGLLNLANNGNVCLGLVGALAPATSCTTA
ncbi:hypothetical protein ADL12_15170 [Streptomyces regalis]|uniref:Uncharacterized protein n=2 Tax=Streptomyces regalis TaxID=68262 RepID=A0A0X3V471_9ACTN|nr:hypothetical protein ADL12_15170 [Streptomyces regalis]